MLGLPGSNMTTGLTFTMNKDAVALVVDQDKKKAIGTAFVFIQTHWAVSARHVVIQDGLPRPQLELFFVSKSNIPGGWRTLPHNTASSITPRS
jgi:hypothetical protein